MSLQRKMHLKDNNHNKKSHIYDKKRSFKLDTSIFVNKQQTMPILLYVMLNKKYSVKLNVRSKLSKKYTTLKPQF